MSPYSPHVKANNKYMKNYQTNKESWYLKFWDVNNVYKWAMSQKLSANGFKWVENTSQFNDDFIKIYNEESDEGYFLEVNVQYLEKLHDLHNDLPILLEIMKIKKAVKLVANVPDKKEYVIHIKHLK